MTFAERLSSLLSKRGDQAALARAIGVQSSTVSDWCSGSKEPGLSNLIKICEYFGSSIDGLLAPVLANASIKKEPVLEISENGRTMLAYFEALSHDEQLLLIGQAQGLQLAKGAGHTAATAG